MTEQVQKGNIAIIKHTDDGETKIETPEEGAVFAIYLKSSGSFDAARTPSAIISPVMKTALRRVRICLTAFTPFIRSLAGRP